MYWREAGAAAGRGRGGNEKGKPSKREEGREEGRADKETRRLGDKGGIGCESTAFEVGSGDLMV